MGCNKAVKLNYICTKGGIVMRKIFELLNTSPNAIDRALADTGVDYIVIDGTITQFIKDELEGDVSDSIYIVEQEGKSYQVHSTLAFEETNNSSMVVYEM